MYYGSGTDVKHTHGGLEGSRRMQLHMQ